MAKHRKPENPVVSVLRDTREVAAVDQHGHEPEVRASRGDLGAEREIAGVRERGRDVLEEVLRLALLDGLPARGPSVVVEPPDQHRELSPQVGRLRHGQAVAQRVQDDPQSAVGSLIVLGAFYFMIF